MTDEMKKLIRISIRNNVVLGIIISLFLFGFLGIKVSFIFLLGIIMASINFGISGIILDKSLNDRVNSKLLVMLITIIRIFLIIIMALPFIGNIMYLLSYLGGLIIHFPILIFSYLRKQKGSE